MTLVSKNTYQPGDVAQCHSGPEFDSQFQNKQTNKPPLLQDSFQAVSWESLATLNNGQQMCSQPRQQLSQRSGPQRFSTGHLCLVLLQSTTLFSCFLHLIFNSVYQLDSVILLNPPLQSYLPQRKANCLQ